MNQAYFRLFPSKPICGSVHKTNGRVGKNIPSHVFVTHLRGGRDILNRPRRVMYATWCPYAVSMSMPACLAAILPGTGDRALYGAIPRVEHVESDASNQCWTFGQFGDAATDIEHLCSRRFRRSHQLVGSATVTSVALASDQSLLFQRSNSSIRNQVRWQIAGSMACLDRTSRFTPCLAIARAGLLYWVTMQARALSVSGYFAELNNNGEYVTATDT